jgi:hypothetical protein
VPQRLAAGDSSAKRVIERDHTPPGGDARIAWGAAVSEGGADARVQSIGADHDGRALDIAIREAHGDAALVLVERSALGAEPDGIRPNCSSHLSLKPGAVDHDERGSEAPLEPARDRRTELRASPAAKRGVMRRSAGGLDRGADAKATKRVDRVGPQRDAGAKLPQLGCALDDEDLAAGPLQRDRRREAADPGADHQRSIAHGATL